MESIDRTDLQAASWQLGTPLTGDPKEPYL